MIFLQVVALVLGTSLGFKIETDFNLLQKVGL